MRPGLVFISLFALLMVVYFSLQSTLGTVTTTVLQVGIVLTLLGSALWLRKRFSPPKR